MIDIHCHILPGIDDGPQNMADALKMARLAVKDGVRTIVATPHCCDGAYNCESQDIIGRCAELEAVLSKEGLDLNILPGAEIRLTPELPAMVEEGRVMTLANGGDLILLELPELFIPEPVVTIIRLLYKKGLRCIIAHPERNGLLLAKNDILTELIFAGAEMQITAESLEGGFGREVKLMAQRLLQMDVQCFLASDGHNSKRRKPMLSKALKTAAKFVGRDEALQLVSLGLNNKTQSSYPFVHNKLVTYPSILTNCSS